MTDTSQTRLAYVPESTYGTTPPTPAFQIMRFTGESFKANTQFVSSNEIRPDRNVSDVTLVGKDAQGDINIEFSAGTFDTLIEAFMCSTWASNSIENGVLKKSFTFEKTFETGVTDQFHRFRGAMVNTFNLNISAREIVTGSFGMMAKDMAIPAQAPITGATYLPSTTADDAPVINASDNFANLSIEGLTGPQIMSLSLSGTNNLRQQPVIGSLGSKGIGAGRFVLTGQMEAYFENEAMYNLFSNNEYTDLSFSLIASDGARYDFILPKIKFTDATIQAGGNDADVMASMSFQAIFDVTEGSTFKITRTPA